MPRAVPFRSQGPDTGNGDRLALAQVQEMKQAKLIERDLPERKSSGAGPRDVPKLPLSRFDERRGPVLLDVVRLLEQCFEHNVSPRCGRPHRVRQVR